MKYFVFLYFLYRLHVICYSDTMVASDNLMVTISSCRIRTVSEDCCTQ